MFLLILLLNILHLTFDAKIDSKKCFKSIDIPFTLGRYPYTYAIKQKNEGLKKQFDYYLDNVPLIVHILRIHI